MLTRREIAQLEDAVIAGERYGGRGGCRTGWRSETIELPLELGQKLLKLCKEKS